MSDSTDDVLIGITASFTPQLLLRPMLDAARGPARVVVADFNQVHQTLLHLSSSFDEMPDRLVVLWRIEDIFGPALTDVDRGRRRPRRSLGTMSGSWGPWSVRPPRTPACRWWSASRPCPSPPGSTRWTPGAASG